MFLMQEMTMLKTKMQTMERQIDYLKNSKRRKVCTINITVAYNMYSVVHMPPTKHTIHDTYIHSFLWNHRHPKRVKRLKKISSKVLCVSGRVCVYVLPSNQKCTIVMVDHKVGQ